jgi:hypothetical protein
MPRAIAVYILALPVAPIPNIGIAITASIVGRPKIYIRISRGRRFVGDKIGDGAITGDINRVIFDQSVFAAGICRYQPDSIDAGSVIPFDWILVSRGAAVAESPASAGRLISR